MRLSLKISKAAHIKDGVAIAKFMYWINNFDKETITELSSIENLLLFVQSKTVISVTASSHCAYKDRAAMMHYSPSKEPDVKIRKRRFLPE